MPRKSLWLAPPLLLVVAAVTWVVVPREYCPDFLRLRGSFGGKPTSHWIETLRTSEEIKERRDAAYALAIISHDSGLDREAHEVLPVLIEGLKDRDEWIQQMSANALGPMGRYASPAIPALTVMAADRECKMRDAAILALGNIGPAAKDAVPVLLEVYRENGDQYRHQFAAHALKQIDPRAATTAGVGK
jgi:HEAT repeat protein